MELFKDGKKLGIGDIVHDDSSRGRGKWRLILFYGCPALELYDGKDILGNPRDTTKIFSYLTHPWYFENKGIKMIAGDRVRRTREFDDILERV